MLSKSVFKNIIASTPLVALDFIIEYDNCFLLGKRINEPAKGYYFVPGGTQIILSFSRRFISKMNQHNCR